MSPIETTVSKYSCIPISAKCGTSTRLQRECYHVLALARLFRGVLFAVESFVVVVVVVFFFTPLLPLPPRFVFVFFFFFAFIMHFFRRGSTSGCGTSREPASGKFVMHSSASRSSGTTADAQTHQPTTRARAAQRARRSTRARTGDAVASRTHSRCCYCCCCWYSLVKAVTY